MVGSALCFSLINNVFTPSFGKSLNTLQPYEQAFTGDLTYLGTLSGFDLKQYIQVRTDQDLGVFAFLSYNLLGVLCTLLRQNGVQC